MILFKEVLTMIDVALFMSLSVILSDKYGANKTSNKFYRLRLVQKVGLGVYVKKTYLA
jgi:hypothetical protein